MDIEQLQQLADNGINITVSVSLADLEAYSNILIANSKRELELEVTAINTEKLLTVDQTREMLGGVAPSTLWEWNRSGYLPRIKTGNGVRYQLTKVNEVMGIRNGKITNKELNK